MTRRLLMVLVGLLGGLVATPRAGAVEVARQFARFERVVIEPYLANLTRVRVFLSLLHIEGNLIENVKPEELQLVVGDGRLKTIPLITRFDFSGEYMDLAVVMELHPSFAAALEDLEEPVEKLLARLPKETTRVSVVGYGERSRLGPLEEPGKAARRWRRLSPDELPEKPPLVDTLKKTIRMLGNATPLGPSSSVRRVILVISDGNDMDAQTADTMDDFRKVAKQANDAGVTIHSIAFASFADNRLLLKNLGELSKKTNGTLRWATTRADFGPLLESVTSELHRQMMLTFYLSDQSIAPGTQLSVICKSPHCEGTLESNVRRAPKTLCAGTACDSSQACVAHACRTARMTGARGGAAAMVAVLIGVLAAGAMGFVYVKKIRPRTQAGKDKAAEVEAAAAPPVIIPQVVVPDFSNMPYVGKSAAAQQMHQQLANLPYVGAAMAQQQAAAAAAAQRPAAPAATPGGRVPQIMVLSGPMQGRTFPLRHGFTVGKMRGCDLLLEDGFTSNHHAQFHIDLGGGCTVVDLGSTNGVYVNGVRATSQRLTHGMSVRVGQTELRFLQG